jgi:hypothetical protein
LQSLTNTIFLARHGKDHADEYLVQAEADLQRLSQQVAKLLNWTGELEAGEIVQDQQFLIDWESTSDHQT